MIMNKNKETRSAILCGGCFIEYENQLLFLRHNANKFQENNWGIPGGKIEKGELLIEGVIREVFEETGIILSAQQLLEVGQVNIDYAEKIYIFHMFAVRITKKPKIQLNATEHEEFKWVTFEEASQLPLITGGLEVMDSYEQFMKIHGKRVKNRTGVYGIAVQDQKMLFTKKMSGPYEGLFDLPGGGLEFGESVEEALKREFKEEVALQFDKMDWVQNLTYSGLYSTNPLLHFFQVGLIYRVFDFRPIPHVIAEDEHVWLSIIHLSLDQLTPFAQKSVEWFRTNHPSYA